MLTFQPPVAAPRPPPAAMPHAGSANLLLVDDDPDLLRLTGVYHNLLRMWAET